MCTRCYDQPLVMTLAFRKFEFYCIDCGGKFGFMDPASADGTDERLRKMKIIEDDFKELSKGLVPDGARLSTCVQCGPSSEVHLMHATAEEKEADSEARKRLHNRVAEIAYENR